MIMSNFKYQMPNKIQMLKILNTKHLSRLASCQGGPNSKQIIISNVLNVLITEILDPSGHQPKVEKLFSI
ncbi:MAG: hypothetical protein UT66_C0013G0020 [candidate division CPR2 bacterium GW2011_GWC1_39_9]|uniref:Uncharacterized protein n=1 Tax=candidate division CPR2 bacterium GW2011_GWC2_39_10 TaxID=1618345 RepID=A0A0G0LQL6_UNCC2|nr:MAG: hypothetical protein UT18_C0012G0020 [candidate division CPR2 bacterium GW2011_GWC2_39_10]KKR35048.1 MAG: hypothetical protein UT66_C0013G0020 [candidate division CPR2 bacterium GW2011_GWC1_39_9]